MRVRLIVVAESLKQGSLAARLAGNGIPERQATSLAGAFCTDTLSVGRHASLAADLWFVPEGASDSLPEIPADVLRIDTGIDEPGMREARLFAQAFEQGYRSVVLTGADSPHLPVALIQEAFGRLTFGYDVVLGPTAEGGNFLIALSAPHPELFSSIGEIDGPGTIQGIAEASGLRTVLLPILNDIGTRESIVRFWRDLRRGVVDAPESLRALEALFERGAEWPPQSIKEKS